LENTLKVDIKFKKFRITPTIHGSMIWPVNDTIIGKCLAIYGEWSEGANIIMSQFVQEGETVLDIGANIGTTVLPLSKSVGDKGKVVAFEPQNLMSQCLNANLTINDITNVDVYNFGISNKSGWTKLNDQDCIESGRYGEASISDEGTRIITITLDELELDNCSFIKMDIEGHEWQALQGGRKFLEKHKPSLYFEAKKEIQNTKKCTKWLFENDWRCYWHFAWWYREKNFNKKKENYFLGDGDMNILAVHKSRSQPKNLLNMENPNEEWSRVKYLEFYDKNNLEII
tara:strand:+ start:957 stop:1814 length:858 start_codon:yes stop_codon:yes gene_type:complete